MNTEIAILTVVCLAFVAPIVGAVLLDRRHKRIRPQCCPFGWGYYNALVGFLAPFLIAGQLRTGQFLGADQTTLRLVLLLAVVIYFPLAILTLRRNRWGFVLLTVLSLNPILWIINTIYIKNRWAELAPDMSGNSR